MPHGVDWLDVGCGQGRIITRLAEIFPQSRFVGLDLSVEATNAGRRQAEANGLSCLSLRQRHPQVRDGQDPKRIVERTFHPVEP